MSPDSRPEPGSEPPTSPPAGRSAADSSPSPALRPEDLTAVTAARLALVNLRHMTPARISWLLSAAGPVEVVDALRSGRYPEGIGPPPSQIGDEVVLGWGKQLRQFKLEAALATLNEHQISILAPDDPRWPFDGEQHPPALLFYQGDLGLLAVPAPVAVVGTRRTTSVGRTVAHQFGFDLASAGCPVVSGLALGVDGAAHRGALDAGGPAIAVVGTGLDVCYPRSHRSLWESVAEDGLLLSEAPAGSPPVRWRFPARNRLIAALSEVVVVVESHRRGGALLTADEAADRGRAVFAVPGSTVSPASDGTNGLLIDGAFPARDADDVLLHLGLAAEGRRPPGRSEATPTPQGDELVATIMAEVATGPVHVDRIITAAGVQAATVLATVRQLAAAGHLQVDGSIISLP